MHQLTSSSIFSMPSMPMSTCRYSNKPIKLPEQLDPTFLINLHPTNRSLAAQEFLNFVNICHYWQLVDDKFLENMHLVVAEMIEIRN